MRDRRRSLALVRTDFRTRLRRLAGNTRQVLAVGGFALFWFVASFAWWPQASSFGDSLTSGPPPLTAVGALLAAVAGVGAYAGIAHAAQRSRHETVEPLLRTSLDPHGIVTGWLIGVLLETTGYVLAGSVVLAVAVGVGAGTPLAPLVLLAGGLPVLVVGILAGHGAGTVAYHYYSSIEVSPWLKAGGLVALMGGSFVVVQRALDAGLVATLTDLLSVVPVELYAAVVLAPLGATATAGGVGAAVGVLAGLALGWLVVVRVETRLLTSEAGQIAERSAQSRSVPRPFRVTAGTRIGWRYLLFGVRNPRRFAHLFPLLVWPFTMAVPVVSEPSLAVEYGFEPAVVLAVVLSGASYCCNPLGEDGTQRPLVLTSVRSPATVLRGRAVAGTAVALLVLLVAALPLGLAGRSPLYVLAGLAVGLCLSLAGVGTALGMGAAIPRFSASEYVGVERAHPSVLLTMAYALGALLFGGAGLYLLYRTFHGAGALTVAGWVVLLAIVGASGAQGYRYAVGRFEGLTVDDY